MKKITKPTIVLFALFVSVSISSVALAAGGKDVVVDHVELNMGDKAALQNGAKLFVNYCLSCHSAGYARYNRVAEDLEIPEALLKDNLMFTTEKPGDLMKSTMPEEDAKRWFGVAPPDLTLVARVRKPDWVYTYLRAFYLDESSPSGWNNSLFENVAMPHAMFELQGVQRLIGKVDAGQDDSSDAHIQGLDSAVQGGQEPASQASSIKVVGDAKFALEHPGKMSPEEFDRAMADLTAFLTYLAEPAQLQRKSIGVYTLLFLLILMGLSYLLKKEYWRDVH